MGFLQPTHLYWRKLNHANHLRKLSEHPLQAVRQIATCPEGIASFSEDESGNLYVVGYEGMVYKLDFNASNFDGELESQVTDATTVSSHQ